MKSSKPRTLWRVAKGSLVPYGQDTVTYLRQRQYHVGDIVSADLRKPRNPKFHGLAHRLGEMLSQNIEDFENLDGHTVLKRLQIEGNIACDDVMIKLSDGNKLAYRVPQSLSFESMDEGQFHKVINDMCKHVSKKYWPSMSAEQIEQLSEIWVND